MGNLDDILVAIAERLVSERKRLNLKQQDVYDYLGMGSATLSRYENGKRSLELTTAYQLHTLGYDMHYVLTGERCNTTNFELSDDESQWLDMYRHLNKADRERVKIMVKALI